MFVGWGDFIWERGVVVRIFRRPSKGPLERSDFGPLKVRDLCNLRADPDRTLKGAKGGSPPNQPFEVLTPDSTTSR